MLNYSKSSEESKDFILSFSKAKRIISFADDSSLLSMEHDVLLVYYADHHVEDMIDTEDNRNYLLSKMRYQVIRAKNNYDFYRKNIFLRNAIRVAEFAAIDTNLLFILSTLNNPNILLDFITGMLVIAWGIQFGEDTLITREIKSVMADLDKHIYYLEHEDEFESFVPDANFPFSDFSDEIGTKFALSVGLDINFCNIFTMDDLIKLKTYIDKSKNNNVPPKKLQL